MMPFGEVVKCTMSIVLLLASLVFTGDLEAPTSLNMQIPRTPNMPPPPESLAQRHACTTHNQAWQTHLLFPSTSVIVLT